MRRLTVIALAGLLCSCSIFKTRSVDKMRYRVDSVSVIENTHSIDSELTNEKFVNKDISLYSQVRDSYAWLIEVDSGDIIKVDPQKGFVGKARAVHFNGSKQSETSSTDKSATSEKTKETKQEVTTEQASKKVSIDSLDKKTVAKPDYSWIAWVTAIGLVIALAAWAYIRTRRIFDL